MTRRQFNRTYHENGPPRQYGRYNNYDRRPGRYQSYNRYSGNRYTDGYRNRSNWSRGFKYDRSPRGRKPRVASRTPDQDRNRCYNCHEFGHFARECQFQANNNQNNHPQPAEHNQNRRTPKPRPHVPGRKHRNTNASFQFSNQDDGIPSEDSEGEMEEPTHLHPFRDESSHLYGDEMSEEDFDSEDSEVECEEPTHVNQFLDDPLNNLKGNKTDASLLPDDCKYPMYIDEKRFCLTRDEADYVYRKIEGDELVTPFVHRALEKEMIIKNFNPFLCFDFDDRYECEDVSNEDCDDDLPFAHCTNVEIGQFFVHRDTKDQELGNDLGSML